MSKLEKTLQLNGLNRCFPIVPGGMGVGVSRWRLAGEVARLGGIGTISSACLDLLVSIEEGRQIDLVEATALEVFRAKELANGNGAIAINIMVALRTSFLQSLEGAILGGVDIVVCGAGLPLSLPAQAREIVARLQASGFSVKMPLLVPIISSGQAGRIICQRWQRQNYVPDAIVIEGPKAGGHLGWNYSQVQKAGNNFLEKYDLTEILYPEVRKTLQELGGLQGFDEKYSSIPLILAGGFSRHEEIEKALELPQVKAIQLGTVFLLTKESSASPEFKEAIRLSTRKEIVLGDTDFGSPCGLPFRYSTRSPLYRKWKDNPKQNREKGYSFCICTTLCGAVGVDLIDQLGTKKFPRGCPLGYVAWGGKCRGMGNADFIPIYTCGTVAAEINDTPSVEERMKNLIG